MRKRISKQSHTFVYTVLVLVVVLVLPGCGRRYQRLLNQQNEAAAAYIQTQPVAPGIRQAANDIELNAVEISGWIGRDETAEEYSAVRSAEIRSASHQAREWPWWKRIVKWIGGVPMQAIVEAVSVWFPQFGMIGSMLVAAWSMWRKWKSDAKVMAGYEAANRILKRVRNGEALSVVGVKQILSDTQALRNVGPDVLRDLQALWAKKQLHKIES